VEEGGGGEEFADFRNRVSDLIKDVVFVVGSSHCFRQMFSSLTGGPGPQGQSIHTPTWDSTEAALFIMQAVAKNILPYVFFYIRYGMKYLERPNITMCFYITEKKMMWFQK